jgi:BirA family biotin operon repressor/biotin-[acetyl-CoA-carboxylase] ligase
MPHLEPCDDFDLSRIRAYPWLADVRFFDELNSTNDVALQLAAEPDCKTPLLVLAKRQTQGRGRGSNQWWANDGSLTFSLLLADTHIPVPARNWPRLPLFAGLAVARALRPYVKEETIRVKWPNDVYLRDRKLGGILVEATCGQKNAMVVGIGLNVNNRLATAPADVAEKAISLVDVLGEALSLTDVLLATLLQISQTFSQSPATRDLFEEWRKLCLLTGRRIAVESGMRRVQGVCTGIDDEGALCIETPTGVERCNAGSVEIL